MEIRLKIGSENRKRREGLILTGVFIMQFDLSMTRVSYQMEAGR